MIDSGSLDRLNLYEYLVDMYVRIHCVSQSTLHRPIKNYSVHHGAARLEEPRGWVGLEQAGA